MPNFKDMKGRLLLLCALLLILGCAGVLCPVRAGISNNSSGAAVPRMQIDVFPLDPATTVDTFEATFTLTNQPAPATSLFLLFASSTEGGDKILAVPANGTALTVKLPFYRPFTSADVLTLVYWTLG